MFKDLWTALPPASRRMWAAPCQESPLRPKTHRHTITVAIVGTEDNLTSVKTLTQRRIERFERQKEGLQAFVDAGAVTQRETDDLLATIHPANWGKNDPPWPSSWITKLSE
tara:strand:+ start:2093 stop:2425 length:333 start_codon:yes stop_codon:yes gene_type:complete